MAEDGEHCEHEEDLRTTPLTQKVGRLASPRALVLLGLLGAVLVGMGIERGRTAGPAASAPEAFAGEVLMLAGPTNEQLAGSIAGMKTMGQIMSIGDVNAKMLVGMLTKSDMSLKDMMLQVGIPIIEMTTTMTMTNPLIGMAASFVTTILGGLLGSKPPNMAKIILEKCKMLIDEALLKAQISENKGVLNSVVEALDWLPAILAGAGQTEQARKQTQLSYYLAFQTNIATLKKAIFNENCISATVKEPSEKCKKWEEPGTVLTSIMFVNLQMSMLIEIAHIEPSYQKGILDRIYDMAPEYMTLLTRSGGNFIVNRLEMGTPWRKQTGAKGGATGPLTGGEDTLTKKQRLCHGLEGHVISDQNYASAVSPAYFECDDVWRREIVADMHRQMQGGLSGIHNIFAAAAQGLGKKPVGTKTFEDSIPMCMLTQVDPGWSAAFIQSQGYYQGLCETYVQGAKACEERNPTSDVGVTWTTVPFSMCQAKEDWVGAPTTPVCKLTDLDAVKESYVVNGSSGAAYRRMWDEGLSQDMCLQSFAKSNGECHQGWTKTTLSECRDFITPQVVIHKRGICANHYKAADVDAADCLVLCKDEPGCNIFSWHPKHKCRYSACGHDAGGKECNHDAQCHEDHATSFRDGLLYKVQFKQIGTGICDYHFKEADVSADKCYHLCHSETNCWKYSWHPKHKCRYSSYGANDGSGAAVAEEKQCPISEEFVDGSVFVIMNKWVVEHEREGYCDKWFIATGDDKAGCLKKCQDDPLCQRYSWGPSLKCRYSACGSSEAQGQDSLHRCAGFKCPRNYAIAYRDSKVYDISQKTH